MARLLPEEAKINTAPKISFKYFFTSVSPFLLCYIISRETGLFETIRQYTYLKNLIHGKDAVVPEPELNGLSFFNLKLLVLFSCYLRFY